MYPRKQKLSNNKFGMDARIGGYCYDFFDPVLEEFTCPICTLVQREAHQVTCCGKIYCKSCLMQVKMTGDQFLCPTCRKSLEGEQKFFPDKSTVIKINHLRIYCPNKKEGCQWVGHLKDLDNNHLPKCPNEVVVCEIEQSNDSQKMPMWQLYSRRNPICGAQVQRCQLEKHMTTECQWRQVICRRCQKQGSYRLMSGEHVEVCPNVLLPCSNEGCPEKIKRCLMADHHNVCPKEVVTCQYVSVGCKTKLKREDISTHNQQCMESHLKSAVAKIDILHSEIEDLHSLTGPNVTLRVHGSEMSGDDSFTTSLYTHKRGYKMRLKGKLSDDFNYYAKNGSLTIFVTVMPSRYDDILEWPLRCKIRVELINQERNEGHLMISNNSLVFEKQVAQPEKNEGWMVVGSFDLRSSKMRRHFTDNVAYLKVNVRYYGQNYILC